jgi:hypothetical protein
MEQKTLMFGVNFSKLGVHLMGHRGMDWVDKSCGHCENEKCCTSGNCKILFLASSTIQEIIDEFRTASGSNCEQKI